MTDDLVERLRERDPAPAPMPPPPIEEVLARIAAAERPARVRWPQWAGPSLAIVVAAGVAALAVVSLRAGHHAASSGHATTHTPTTASTPGPGSGPLRVTALGNAMRGSLRGSVLGFGSSDAGVVAWMQFTAANTAHPKAWLAATGDGGSSWSVQRRSFSLFANPSFDGSRDAWTQAIDSTQTLRFYVTHDGGVSWTPAQSAAAADSVPGDVSVAGGVVWAVGTGSCANNACRWVVMRGPASRNSLPATAGQPLPPTNQNATTISAGSATTAYVEAPAGHGIGTVAYATHDGGRHWHRLPNPCAGGSTEFGVNATGADSVWLVCVRSKQFFAMRSTDGGAHWSSERFPFIPLFAFEPVSSEVAWSQDIHGTIYRTANGGASWQPVWRSGGPHGRPNPGFSPILSAQSGADASVLVQLTRGPISHAGIPRSTNLIVYRTSNGGSSWSPSVIKLPRG